MFMFLISLIIASILYIIYGLKNYSESLEDQQNVIRGLESKAEKYNKAVEQEREQNRAVVELLRKAKGTESELKHEIALTATQVKMAQKRESELEMNMYKQEFKRSRQRGF